MTLWKSILKKNFHKTEALLDFLDFDEKNRALVLQKARFCLNVPIRLAEKMAKNAPDDPLFLQFVPLKKELDKHHESLSDPVQDRCFQKTALLLQKYQSRALLVTNGVCAMHCRFCFRQNYPYNFSEKVFEKELAIIKSDPSIHEIILSGGDPLSLSDDILRALILNINQIPHIKVIRFHTRFLIGIPERVSEEFLSLLKESKKQIVFALHINHKKELDQDVFDYVKKIQLLGIPVLTQTVLLKDVNDTKEALKELFLDLISKGMIPYYLHTLDPVQGAMHFDVSIEEAKGLIKELRKELPGYSIPRLVKEIPGKEHKTPIFDL
ncbi:MAG: KamA family radical SAM protein [Chlamydiae bacterium]|nr:KamA family radical SAM protein [Chlamydiota bacterium]